ncbi:hypothetical protein [Bordetella genomosp. 13]|uniref:hypothetical protein n=1 Tax=Bordetella genomosp. 13 TaxID=463040 RepID=UPI0018E04123|nr:hypothetical protein [Bordetella genomosp. 13]
MNWLSRVKRPEVLLELCGVMLLALYMSVLPHAHLYCQPYSQALTTQTTEGVLDFRRNNKTGQVILINGQVFTCAQDTIVRNDCYYRSGDGTSVSLPNELVGKHGIVQWTSFEVFPWQTLKVVISLSVDGKFYRTAADFDRSLAFSKKSAMQWDLFVILLFLVYAWFRLYFRPRLYKH